MEPIQPRFDLGRIVATPGALSALETAGDAPGPLLYRHRCADFGQLDANDVRMQNEALRHENDTERRERMMSVYPLSNQVVIWIITEADRSSTCILLPEDY